MKQNQVAFLYRSFSEKKAQAELKDGDQSLLDFVAGDFHRSAKIYEAKDPRVSFLVSPFSFATYWWFYYKGRCVVYVGALNPTVLIMTALKKIGIQKSLTMHSVSAPSFRGRGYVSFVYDAALRRNYTLVTGSHSKDAHQLWSSLARRHKATIAYYAPEVKLLRTKNSDLPLEYQKSSLKLLIPASVVSSLKTILI